MSGVIAGVLTAARADLAAALVAGGLRAYTTPPEVPQGDDGDPDDAQLPYPLAYVVPAEPYLSWQDEGLMYGEALLRLNVSVLAANSGNTDVEAAELDTTLLEAYAIVLELDGWNVTQFLQPGRIVINNAQHLACAIEVARPIQILEA